MIVRLKRGKAKPLWAGHPWVYSGAVQRVEGSAEPGALVAIVDDRDALIGWGHVSPDAPIAVRLWAYAPPGAPVGTPPPDARTLVRERLAAAAQRRRLLGLPSADTDAYRLVNSEGDRMPGVIVDVYGDAAVLALGTPGAAAWQDLLAAQIQETTGVRAVERRVSPDAARLEGVPEIEPPDPPDPDDGDGDADDGDGAASDAGVSRETPIHEGGVRFLIDPVGGQKTGFYLDQRETRATVAALAKGRSVLDVCSFGAAFSLRALKAGAARAVAVDTSPRAQELAERSALANGLEGLTFDRRDAFVVMRERASAGERFDIVVVDPPKFARGRRDLEAALQKYARLNELALRCLAPDGLFVTCSCSRHVSESDLERAVADAAQRSGRVLHLLRAAGQAADHPTLAAFPEGRYLKVLMYTTSARA